MWVHNHNPGCGHNMRGSSSLLYTALATAPTHNGVVANRHLAPWQGTIAEIAAAEIMLVSVKQISIDEVGELIHWIWSYSSVG